MAKMKLLCLPYAGSSAMNYLSWRHELGNDIEVVPIELPGRGKRIREPLVEVCETLMEDVYHQVSQSITEHQYSLFGHSMGGLLTFEVLHKLVEAGKPLPKHVFISGSRAPMFRGEKKNYRQMDNQTFIDEICTLGGMSEDILRNKELMELFTPVIRADFNVLEDYSYNDNRDKIPCPVTIFYGREDHHATKESVGGWEACFETGIDYQAFEGGHFFINQQTSKVINQIKQTIR
ncbi:MAG: thioesterase II family protein [Cellulosilyticaceae bacterium]